MSALLKNKLESMIGKAVLTTATTEDTLKIARCTAYLITQIDMICQSDEDDERRGEEYKEKVFFQAKIILSK